MKKYIYIACIITSNFTAGETLVFDKIIHNDSIASHCIKDKAIISGSFDGTIKETTDYSSKVVGKHKTGSERLFVLMVI